MMNNYCCSLFGTFGTVYSLSDKNGSVFYVGCTVLGLKKRLAGHLNDARANHYYNNCKKREKILSLNMEISANILEEKWITAHDKQTALKKLIPLETEWIEKYLDAGHTLCNFQAKKKSRRKESVPA